MTQRAPSSGLVKVRGVAACSPRGEGIVGGGERRTTSGAFSPLRLIRNTEARCELQPHRASKVYDSNESGAGAVRVTGRGHVRVIRLRFWHRRRRASGANAVPDSIGRGLADLRISIQRQVHAQVRSA